MSCMYYISVRVADIRVESTNKLGGLMNIHDLPRKGLSEVAALARDYLNKADTTPQLLADLFEECELSGAIVYWDFWSTEELNTLV